MSKKINYQLQTEDLFLFFCSVLFFWIRFHHFDIVLERDEGEYAYAGQEILRGKLPYTDFYNMKFPGTYYLYALIFYYLGDSVSTIKIMLLLINLVSACAVFGIAKLWYNRKVAQLATGIFLIFSVGFSGQGWTANSEHFVVVFALLGIYFSSQFVSKNKVEYLFLSGFFLSCATLCKQHGIFFAVFPVLQFLLSDKNSHFKKLLDLKFLKTILCYGIGFAIPCGLMIYYFYVEGILSKFYFFTIAYATAYAEMEIPFRDIWRFMPIFWDAVGFWILFFTMVYLAFRRKFFFKEHRVVLLFTLCGFVATSWGWYYRPHYFQYLFPGAAIMSAYILANLKKFWTFKFINPQKYLTLCCCMVLALQYNYIFRSDSQTVTDTMYPAMCFNEMNQIADTINAHFGDKNYKIGIVGNEPEVFFYTRKQSSTGFIYNYLLVEKHKYADSLMHQYFREFNDSPPEILLYLRDYKISPENKKNALAIDNWYNQYKKNYTTWGVLDSLNDKPILKWRTKEKSTIKIDSAFYGVIYLRKDIEKTLTMFQP